MTEPDDRQDHLIRLLAPIHHLPPSAQNPLGGAATELLENIMGDVQAENPIPAKRRSWPARHRWLATTVPTVAAAAALALGLSAVLPTGSGPIGPAPAQALQITEDDGYMIIEIKDPVADPQRYREELARHNLDIELFLIPADPDWVNRIMYVEARATTEPANEALELAPGACTTDGYCSIRLRVPVTFKSHATIVIGRPPMPGEDPNSVFPARGREPHPSSTPTPQPASH